MPIDVTVTTAQQFDQLNENGFLDITFTNTNAFTYAAGNVYYYALLTDSSVPALTQEVTFMINHAVGGTITANTDQKFTMENTQNLVPSVVGSDGRILYHA